MTRRIHVITHFVSPYQVELFNSIANRCPADLFVTYLYDSWKGRHWKNIAIDHSHCVLQSESAKCETEEHVAEAEVVVFNAYRDRVVRELMRRRARQKSPWVFWGERPAYRYKGRVGTLYRRWRLGSLVRSRAPVWGIGSWASAKYRSEFGNGRVYETLPYYSDLTRFRRPVDSATDDFEVRRFLFSGALIARKGVDLLARSFSTLIRQRHRVQLTILGTGELEATLRKQLAHLDKHVHWAGFQEWRALPEWYHQSHVLVAPSRYDGWGLIVPEGLSAGLPVIATDQMGAAIDLIRPNENGWICRAGDQRSLTDTLQRVAAMPASSLRDHCRAAEASVSAHQLEDGATRFVELCDNAIRHWTY
jgi:glycosyltransferase involved in cell wall biosynthesis